MMQYWAKFRRDDDGAVTIDWIVLVAALVGLAFAVVKPIGDASDEYADDTRRCMVILGNRINRQDGTAQDYSRELRIAQRNCARVR